MLKRKIFTVQSSAFIGGLKRKQYENVHSKNDTATVRSARFRFVRGNRRYLQSRHERWNFPRDPGHRSDHLDHQQVPEIKIPAHRRDFLICTFCRAVRALFHHRDNRRRSYSGRLRRSVSVQRPDSRRFAQIHGHAS